MEERTEKCVRNFGFKLQEIRTKYGYSRQYLAEHTGIDASAISRYERCLSEPTLSNFIKICMFLNVSPNRMLGLKE